MNIIFDNIIFPLQNHGGISVVWYELLKRVLIDADFNCKFIDIPNENFLRQKLEIPSNCILKNNLSKFPFKIQRYINPKINDENGIFHSSYFRTVNNPNIVNISTVHDFTYEYFFKGFPKIIHHQQKCNAIKHSEKIICVSENTKADLLKFYPKVKENQIEVVYNGVSEDYHKLSPTENKQINQYIPFQTKEYVLYVGDRKSGYKNFSMLVEACKITKFPLVIVGGGELTKNEQLLLMQSIGIEKYTQLIGLSNLQLNLLYNNAAFFVYPSAYEGFGIPILEAQKAGCPVICSNLSSIPEVAGKGAYIIENISSQKIADILLGDKSNSSQTNKIIKDGHINAERFSWDKCYQQTKKVYSDVYSDFF